MMKYNEISPLFLLVLFVLISYSFSKLLEKGCRMSEFESKIALGTSFAKDATWPINEQEIDDKCRLYPRGLNESRKFVKRCTKGEAKTILGVSVHSIEKMTLKLFCRGKNVNLERRKLTETAKCVNTGTKTSSKCWRKMVNSLWDVANTTNDKNKIPMLCCSLILWKDCFVNVYEKTGAPTCTSDHIEYIDQYLYKSMIDPMNIFCSEYEDSDKCNKLGDFFTKSSSNKAKFETPFPPIIKLFESL